MTVRSELTKVTDQSMHRKRLVWIVGVAFSVRVAMIVWALSGLHVAPQVYLSKQYFQEGYAISAGWGYSTNQNALATLTSAQQSVERGERNPGSDVARPADFYGETLHPPGMSLLVATMHRIFGGDAKIAMMVLGALLDSGAAAILYLMVAAAWSEPVAFLAAMTYALFLPQAYAVTADLLPNGLESFFVIAGFACVLSGLRHAKSRSYPGSYKWFSLAGVVFGLGGYLRPDYDLIAIGLFPFLWIYGRNWRKAITASLVMLTVTSLTLLPWAYRNHVLYGHWTFTSSAVGSTLVESLGEFNNPWGIGYNDDWLVREAKRHGFKSAWTTEADDYFNALFVRDVRQHPLAFVATIEKRIPLALAPPHLFGLDNPFKTKTFTEQRALGLDRYQMFRRHPLYVLAAYWDALLFAAVSFTFLVCSLWMLWAERRRWQLVALLMAPHIYGIGTHLLSDIEPRYILPSMFSLMIGFAYCLRAVWVRASVRFSSGPSASSIALPRAGLQRRA